MDLQGSPANYSAGLFSEGAVRLPAQRTPHRGGRLSKENAEWHGRAGHGEPATARRQRRQGRVRVRGDAQVHGRLTLRFFFRCVRVYDLG